MKNEVEKLVSRIKDMEARLAIAETNNQYIQRLKSICSMLDKLHGLLVENNTYQGVNYRSVWDKYFSASRFGWSYYERVLNSVETYKHGYKPF